MRAATRTIHAVLSLCLWVLGPGWSSAEKDSQIYPWGDNPNTNYKMYWKDSPNILEDLAEFSSLYIRVHRCVWSEYGLGTSYDDDGENHDGDENWYMTRYQPFRANAAFSLYGVLKGENNFGRNCRKKTYINTFFTYLGADSLLQALGNNFTAFPDQAYGSAYCYEAEDEDEQNSGSQDSQDRRKLGSGSGDDNGMSMTMGCTVDGDFVIAKFQGEQCEGANFINGTQESLDDYNDAMDGLQCSRIWNRRDYIHSRRRRRLEDAQQGDDATSYVSVYGSPAELILSTSFACDIDLFPDGQCPDPYGLKAKYAMNLKTSAKRNKSVQLRNWQTPMRVLSFMFLFIAIGLGAYSYFLINKRSIKSKGGGAKGIILHIGDDIKQAALSLFSKKAEPSSKGSKKKKKKKSKEKSVAMPNSETETQTQTQTEPHKGIINPPSKSRSRLSAADKEKSSGTEKTEIV